VALVVAACGPGSPPRRLPCRLAAPSALATASLLTLESCDLTGYVPCEHSGRPPGRACRWHGVALTYSSEWAPGRKDRSNWDVAAEGLGGWSLDISSGTTGTGYYLSVTVPGVCQGVVLASGERVVPTYDGLRAYVFDAKGRHVRTVDALLEQPSSRSLTTPRGGWPVRMGRSTARRSTWVVVATMGPLGPAEVDGVQTHCSSTAAGHLGASAIPRAAPRLHAGRWRLVIHLLRPHRRRDDLPIRRRGRLVCLRRTPTE